MYAGQFESDCRDFYHLPETLEKAQPAFSFLCGDSLFLRKSDITNSVLAGVLEDAHPTTSDVLCRNRGFHVLFTAFAVGDCIVVVQE